jgi:hypothetical protein
VQPLKVLRVAGKLGTSNGWSESIVDYIRKYLK